MVAKESVTHKLLPPPSDQPNHLHVFFPAHAKVLPPHQHHASSAVGPTRFMASSCRRKTGNLLTSLSSPPRKSSDPQFPQQ